MAETLSVNDSIVATRISRVHANMAVSVLVSLLVAYCVGTSSAAMSFIASHLVLKILICLAPFAILIICATSLVCGTKSRSVAAFWMLAFSSSFGLVLSSVFAKYAFDTVLVALVCTAVMYSVAAIYGFVTKRTLESWGDFLIAVLIVLIVVSVINIFIGSTWLTYLISCVSVVVYLAFTVFDSNMLRDAVRSQLYTPSDELMYVINFYLDFVGMFVNLLTILGDD